MSLTETGLDIVLEAGTWAGITFEVVDVPDYDPFLVYDLNDGTAFFITGTGRNEYAVTRVNSRETHLNMAEVVRILTFQRPLGDPTRPAARRRWFSTNRLRADRSSTK
jgi:hypothetical protein